MVYGNQDTYQFLNLMVDLAQELTNENTKEAFLFESIEADNFYKFELPNWLLCSKLENERKKRTAKTSKFNPSLISPSEWKLHFLEQRKPFYQNKASDSTPEFVIEESTKNNESPKYTPIEYSEEGSSIENLSSLKIFVVNVDSKAEDSSLKDEDSLDDDSSFDFSGRLRFSKEHDRGRLIQTFKPFIWSLRRNRT
jgi:hypothetical protein